MSDGAGARYHAVAINASAPAVSILVRFFILCITPSPAAGRLKCGWCEAEVLKPVGCGDLFAFFVWGG